MMGLFDFTSATKAPQVILDESTGAVLITH